jgi:hypothetical protein
MARSKISIRELLIGKKLPKIGKKPVKMEIMKLSNLAREHNSVLRRI